MKLNKFLFILLFLIAISFSWYYSGTHSRRVIIISNTGNEDAIDYQVLINISYQFKMNANFSDLRFTYLNTTTLEEVALPYWIEAKQDGQWANVWIKVPKIPANGNATVYLYFGNPNAESENNGEAVFEFFDDFDGVDLDPNKWSTGTDTTDYTISNSKITIGDGKNDYDRIVSNVGYSNNIRLIFYGKFDTTELGYHRQGLWDWDNKKGWCFDAHWENNRNGNVNSIDADIDQNYVATGYDTPYEGKYEIRVKSDKSALFYIDDSLVVDHGTQSAGSDIPIIFTTYDANTYATIDWVAVAKYNENVNLQVNITNEIEYKDLIKKVYLQDFKYVHRIYIGNYEHEDRYNQSIKIILPNSQKFGKNDLSDTRFLWKNPNTGEREPIPYWVEDDGESGGINGNFTIWIKIPYLPAQSDSEVYMYMGNPNAESENNGEAVFEFFDDFDNLDNWSIGTLGIAEIVTLENNNLGLKLSGDPNSNENFTVGYVLSQRNFNSWFSNTKGGLAIRLKRKFTNKYKVDVSIGNGNIQCWGNGQTENCDISHLAQGNGYMWLQETLASHRIEKTPAGEPKIELRIQDYDTEPPFGEINEWETDTFVYTKDGWLHWIYNDTLKMSVQDTDYLNSDKYLILSQGYDKLHDRGGISYYDWIFIYDYYSDDEIQVYPEKVRRNGMINTSISGLKNDYFDTNVHFNVSFEAPEEGGYLFKVILNNEEVYSNSSASRNRIYSFNLSNYILHPGEYNLIIKIEDTITGSLVDYRYNFSVRNWEYISFDLNQTVPEGTLQNYTEHLKINRGVVDEIRSYLFWNGTKVSEANETIDGEDVYLTTQYLIPVVIENQTNVSVYFENLIIYKDGSNETMTSDIKNQTVIFSYIINSILYKNLYYYNSHYYCGKTLEYTLNLSCPISNKTILIGMIDNNGYNNSINYTCVSTNPILTLTFNETSDGNKNVKGFIIIDNITRSTVEKPITFDLTPPSTEILSYERQTGYKTSFTTKTLTLRGDDDLSGTGIKCNFITKRGNETIINETRQRIGDDDLSFTKSITYDKNTLYRLTLNCSDFVGNYNVTSIDIDNYVYKFIMVSERDGGSLQMSNFSVLEITSPNEGHYDLKANNRQNIILYPQNLSETVTVIFEFVDVPGQQVRRAINLELLGRNERDIKVCIPKEPQALYQMIFYGSKKMLPIKLISDTGHCYNLVDYTTYAYDEGYMVSSTTIPIFYNLKEGDTLLSKVDGSIASTINLDLIDLKKKNYSISLTGDTIAIDKIENNTIEIYYENQQHDNEKVNILLTQNSRTFLNYTEHENPNKFYVYVNWDTVNLSIKKPFQVKLTKYKNDGRTLVETKVFYPSGEVGFLPTSMVIIITVFLLLFGLTLVATKYALGWFGVVIILTSLAITTLAPPTNVILLLQATIIIILTYVLIVYAKQYAAVT